MAAGTLLFFMKCLYARIRLDRSQSFRVKFCILSSHPRGTEAVCTDAARSAISSAAVAAS
jgi:hypothetical protein